MTANIYKISYNFVTEKGNNRNSNFFVLALGMSECLMFIPKNATSVNIELIVKEYENVGDNFLAKAVKLKIAKKNIYFE